MKKIVNILLALSISFGSIFAMKRPNHNHFNNEPQIALEQRIDELIKNGDAESEKTLKNFAMLFYYIECLFEVVNAEKLAANKRVDTPDFDDHMDELISAINGLFGELSDEDIKLFKDFDAPFSFVESGFNFDGFMVFIEARRRFAKLYLKYLEDFYAFLQEFKGIDKDQPRLKNVADLLQGFDYKGLNKNRIKFKDAKFLDFSKQSKIDREDIKQHIATAEDIVKEVLLKGVKSCLSCGKIQDKPSMCGSCKSVFYCSRECQKIDWKKHKNNCKNLLSDKKNFESRKIYKLAQQLCFSLKEWRKAEKVIESHHKISKNFFDYYMQSRLFKKAISDIYKNIRTVLDEKEEVSVGLKESEVLPLRVFYINDLIVTKSESSTEHLKIFFNAVTIFNNFSRRNSFQNKTDRVLYLRRLSVDESEWLDNSRNCLLQSVEDDVLRSQLRQFLTFNVWKYRDKMIFIGYSRIFSVGSKGSLLFKKDVLFPRESLFPMIWSYWKLLDSELDLRKRSMHEKKKKKKKKKKTIFKKEKAVAKADESSRRSEEEKKLLKFEDNEKFFKKEEKVENKRKFDRLAKKIKQTLFEHDGGGVYHAKTDCVRVEKVFGSLMIDCVISDMKLNKRYNIEDLPFSFGIAQFCRPEYNNNIERYMKQNHFHNFSKYVDVEMQKGLGSVITSTDELPECCKSPYARALDKDNRIAIVLEGGLGTNKYYDNLRFPHGCYMWIYSKDQRTNEWMLIHRCFHAEQH